MIYDIDSVKSLAMSQLAGLSPVWFYGMKTNKPDALGGLHGYN